MDVLNKFPRTMFLLSMSLVFSIGYLDYKSGTDASMLLFYLIPVLHATWFVSHRAGVFISLASAGMWFFSNYYMQNRVADPGLTLWNTVVRLGIFLLVAYIVAIQSALRKSLRREKELARIDNLTGAVNSRAFTEAVSQEINRSRRNSQPFSVAYIDLDNFKTVNDTLGHSVGDTVLKMAVQTLRTSIRNTDTFARLGGDEFAILLPETSEAGAAAIAEKCREELLIVMKQNRWPVSASIGVATFVTPPEAYDALIQVADALMYEAKKSGKDCIRTAVYQRSTVLDAHEG